MISRPSRHWWGRLFLRAALVLCVLLVALAIAVPLLNPRLTRTIKGPAFLAEMNKQTAYEPKPDVKPPKP